MSDQSDGFDGQGYADGGEVAGDGDWQDDGYIGGYEPAPQAPAQQGPDFAAAHAHEHDRRVNAEAQLLVHDYPELQDAGVVERLAPIVQERAAQLGRPDLVGDPEFVRMAIEANGGLSQERQLSAAEQIVAAGNKKVLPF